MRIILTTRPSAAERWAWTQDVYKRQAYPLSKTWNIEWELGGAAVWARYNEYRCRECGAFLGRKHGWYLIPSRVALNMIYLF